MDASDRPDGSGAPADKTSGSDTFRSPGPFFETPSVCPLCRRDIAMRWQKGNIPYFGDIMFITSACPCGFHFSDTMILSSKDPVMYEIVLKDRADLNARVVRSASGTVILPEMGIMIEPGQVSESYVTNVEGVLQKVRGVVESAVRWSADDPEKVKTGENLLSWIDALTADPKASPRTTMIIKDPLGNSAIIAAGAVSRKLTPEEAAGLKTGMIILNADKDELQYDISENAGPVGRPD